MESLFLIVFIFTSVLLSLAIGLAAWLLSDKSPDSENLSPYECGFDPFGQPGHPISIKFFLVAILFLIFDLEVSLLFPWSTTISSLIWFNQVLLWLFVILLVGGLLYEWVAGGLEWE